jgi:hypothetical protein
MKGRKKRAMEIQVQIGRILWEEWDPIGVRGSGPEGEYDSYVGGIYRLLASGADKYELLDHMYQLETNSMGLQGNKERLEPVVLSLMNLDVGL